MPIVWRPATHPSLHKGIHVRIALVSLASDFTGFRSTSEALLYMRSFYLHRSLVSAHLFIDGSEQALFKNGEENIMGLLNATRAENAHLASENGAPFADKAALYKTGEEFRIVNIRARKSNFTGKAEYLFDVDMLQSSTAYNIKDEKKGWIPAKLPVDQLTISQESARLRDVVVEALCQAMGIDYSDMFARNDPNPDFVTPYGPCIITKKGRAFEIVDYEEEGVF